MAKSREKIQQLGFWDSEVSKPDHDSVCLWAYENAELIFNRVYPEFFDQEWKDSEITLGSFRNENAASMLLAFRNNNLRPNPRIHLKTLEYVLKSYTGYENKLERIVGYADLLIETKLPNIYPIWSEVGEEIQGYELHFTTDKSPKILVEAKSSLPTMGELMRQLQLYRTAFNGKLVVVSPDDRYEKILSEQGVTFIKSS